MLKSFHVACIARGTSHCTKFVELLNTPVLHHLPHSIDAWIISPGLEAHLKQSIILFVSPGDTLAYPVLTWLWQGIQYVWTVISRLYLHSSLWQQNESPLWRVVLRQNEITASHFVAESLMQFSRPIVVTEPPHRRALAITNSYAYVPSIYLLSHALVSLLSSFTSILSSFLCFPPFFRLNTYIIFVFLCFPALLILRAFSFFILCSFPDVPVFFLLSVCLSIYLSACLSVRPSASLSVRPSDCPSARLSVRPSICLSVRPFPRLFPLSFPLSCFPSRSSPLMLA